MRTLFPDKTEKRNTLFYFPLIIVYKERGECLKNNMMSLTRHAVVPRHSWNNSVELYATSYTIAITTHVIASLIIIIIHSYTYLAVRRESRAGANEVILADTSMLIPVADFLTLDSIYLPCYLAHSYQQKDNEWELQLRMEKKQRKKEV